MAAVQAKILLRAAGGRPDDALQFAASGRDPLSWAALPKAMLRGDVGAFKDWTPMDAIDALHKLCHDLLAVKTGAQPRFFEVADLPPAGKSGGTVQTLTHWARELTKATRTMEHPFNAGLMLEDLASQAKIAMNSVHSAY
jgi:DNA polymerase-3 subunit delta'